MNCCCPLCPMERVASIDLKKEEAGIIGYCQDRNLPFVTFTKEELALVEGTFAESKFMEEVTGVDNVCERSAVLGSSQDGVKSMLILRKYAEDGDHHSRPEGNGVCILNKLYVVGIGPGAYEKMTIEAADALKNVMTIGYTVYVDLVKDHFTGKEFLTTPMKKEVERCVMGLEELLRKERQFPTIRVAGMPAHTAAAS